MTFLRNALTCLAVILATALSSNAQMNISPGATGLGFGGTVSADGHRIVVGSAPTGWPRGDEPASSVYIYEKDSDGEWVESARLRAADGMVGDDFGRTVFMSDDMVVVGAPGMGAAYVFTFADGSWSQTGKLVPSSLPEGAEFGGAYARAGNRTGNIARAGNQIVVTSYDGTTNTGQAHVFSKTSDGWNESSVLSAATANEGDGFGMSVAADEGNIFVSAPLTNERAGLVYVFMNHGYWMQMGSLSPSAEGPSSLGVSMVTADGKVYVGAPQANGIGTVNVYAKQSSGMFGLERTIEPVVEEGQRIFGFGGSVATHENLLLATSRGAGWIIDLASDSLTMVNAPNERARPGFGTGAAFAAGAAVIGSPGADFEAGIASVFELSESGEWTGMATLASDVNALSSYSGEKIECEEGTAREFACDNVDMVSFMNIGDLSTERGVGMTDIWGWEDPETGKEWVIIGRTEGVSFVDISDPAHPVWVGEMLKTEGSPGSGWRDVKVYRDHAFVVADGAEAHGMQIFDLRQLRDVSLADMPVTFKETAHYAGTNSTHNVVINEDSGFAYAVGNRSGGETCGGQLHMINVQDPQNPTFAGCYPLPESGGTHDSQCVLYHGEDADYTGREICFNSNSTMFVIGDVTDKSNPVTLAYTSYPNQAYTHQGWLSEDHNYFFLNDELDEVGGLTEQTRTLIWDVRDLDDPVLAREFFLDNPASDHNLYIRDNIMYQSNYQAGLRIIDVADPLNPVEIGHFDTVPFGEDEAGFGGSWSNYPYFKSGIIAVSSRGEGLFLLRKREVDI